MSIIRAGRWIIGQRARQYGQGAAPSEIRLAGTLIGDGGPGDMSGRELKGERGWAGRGAGGGCAHPLVFHALRRGPEQRAQLVHRQHRHRLRACVDALRSHHRLQASGERGSAEVAPRGPNPGPLLTGGGEASRSLGWEFVSAGVRIREIFVKRPCSLLLRENVYLKGR